MYGRERDAGGYGHRSAQRSRNVCNISFYGVDYDLKLQSVQVMDMAGVTTLFAEDQQARELTSSELSATAAWRPKPLI